MWFSEDTPHVTVVKEDTVPDNDGHLRLSYSFLLWLVPSLSIFVFSPVEQSQTKEIRLRQFVHEAGNFAVQKHVISQKPGDQKDVLLGAVIVSALLARTFPYRWTFKWRLTDICFLLFYRTAKAEAAPRSSASLLEPIISVWGTWHSIWPPVKYRPMGLLCLTVFGQLGTVQTGFRKARVRKNDRNPFMCPVCVRKSSWKNAPDMNNCCVFHRRSPVSL